MISLGIDPGTATTGYGVVKSENNSFSCLDYGVITTDKTLPPSRRLFSLSREILSLIKEYSPSVVGIESLYFFKNLKTVIPVSQAKGVIMVMVEGENIPLYEFTPLEVKMSITGYGRADKNQIQEMTRIILNLKEKPHPDDAADGLAIAICGLNKITSPF